MNLRQVQVVDAEDASNVMTANLHIPATSHPHQAAVVMLPFWGGYAEIYRKAQVGLAETCPQIPTIAISYRGTGAAINKDLDVDHRKFAISTTSANVLKFLRSEAITSLVDTSRLILCGHSWSAKVSMSILSRDAPKAGITVAGLVYIGPSPPTPIILDPEDREYRRGAYNSLESAKFTIENVLAYQKLTDEEVNNLAHNMVSMSVAAKKSWVEVGIWEDWTTDIKEFVAKSPNDRVPVHVIAADHDNVEPAPNVEKQTVEFLRDLGFPVTYEKLKDCGHLIPMERPEAIIGAVKTLAAGQV